MLHCLQCRCIITSLFSLCQAIAWLSFYDLEHELPSVEEKICLNKSHILPVLVTIVISESLFEGIKIHHKLRHYACSLLLLVGRHSLPSHIIFSWAVMWGCWQGLVPLLMAFLPEDSVTFGTDSNTAAVCDCLCSEKTRYCQRLSRFSALYRGCVTPYKDNIQQPKMYVKQNNYQVQCIPILRSA